MSREIYNYKNGLALHQWNNGKWSVIYEMDCEIKTISWAIATELEIREREFDAIIDKYPHIGPSYFYLFETKEEAQKVLDDLEALMIMKKLIN